MLMMTHTWLLRNFLRDERLIAENLELFVYNICPDLLPLHRDITAADTHGIARCATLPPEHRKNAFVHFHLMVDDLSHHGMITAEPVREFNPDSNGYTYLKGKPLVQPLQDIYARQGTPIAREQAAYRSHMIIEMTFDLAMHLAQIAEGERMISLLCDAMQFTVAERLNEFCNNISWLYGFSPDVVRETMIEGAAFYHRDRIRRFMTMEGRINLFAGKFGIARDDMNALEMLRQVMNMGMELVRDYEDFLEPTLAEIRRAGFNPVY